MTQVSQLQQQRLQVMTDQRISLRQVMAMVVYTWDVQMTIFAILWAIVC